MRVGWITAQKLIRGAPRGARLAFFKQRLDLEDVGIASELSRRKIPAILCEEVQRPLVPPNTEREAHGIESGDFTLETRRRRRTETVGRNGSCCFDLRGSRGRRARDADTARSTASRRGSGLRRCARGHGLPLRQSRARHLRGRQGGRRHLGGS